MPKTKIICTLGPASNNKTVLRKMMLCGMDIVRLNFSHGSHAEHANRIKLIRELNRNYRRRIKILQDLEGYRIRIGRLKPEGGIELKKKKIYRLTNRSIFAEGDAIPFDYKGPLSAIRPGSLIFIDDGNIALVVKSGSRADLKVEVIVGGLLKEHKGVNIPEVNLKFKGLTEKDKIDLKFGIEHNVDFIAQSFVRDRHDMLGLRQFIGPGLKNCKLIAKVENRQGIKNIDGIIDVSEGIMIARGDMGVSLPIYEIPMIQKMIIKKCNQRRKLVITATQMLESMTQNIRPTRAEVTDVANAILDGTDLVMLSAETAVGKYPAESVRMMNSVIKYTEASMRGKHADIG